MYVSVGGIEFLINSRHPSQRYIGHNIAASFVKLNENNAFELLKVKLYIHRRVDSKTFL